MGAEGLMTQVRVAYLGEAQPQVLWFIDHPLILSRDLGYVGSFSYFCGIRIACASLAAAPAECTSPGIWIEYDDGSFKQVEEES